eukprot:scaffold2067_cov238-Pinguiococcus_pyrenoidosus.AAC.3
MPPGVRARARMLYSCPVDIQSGMVTLQQTNEGSTSAVVPICDASTNHLSPAGVGLRTSKS